jgi:hypothetical protein
VSTLVVQPALLLRARHATCDIRVRAILLGMDYQWMGFLFACVGATMSVLYLGLGVKAVRVLQRATIRQDEGRTPSFRDR